MLKDHDIVGTPVPENASYTRQSWRKTADEMQVQYGNFGMIGFAGVDFFFHFTKADHA